MHSAKKIVVTAATFSLAIIVFAVCVPKAAHAFVATLVQVVNTPSNPVPTAPTASHQAVSLKCEGVLVSGQSSQLCTMITQGAAYTVPMGKRLVIENVSGWIFFSEPGQQTPGQFQIQTQLNGDVANVDMKIAPAPSPIFYTIGQTIVAYADSGTNVTLFCSRFTQASFTGSVTCFGQIVGHLEDN